MRKFIGKVNGVEYTDEKEFNDAVLEAFKAPEGYNISSEYVETDDEKSDLEVLDELKKKLNTKKEVDFSLVKVDDDAVEDAIKNNDYYALKGELIKRQSEVRGMISDKNDAEKLTTVATELEKQVDHNLDCADEDIAKIESEVDEMYAKITEMKNKVSKLRTKKSYLGLVKDYYHKLTGNATVYNNLNKTNNIDKYFNNYLFDDLNSAIRKFWF